MSLYDVALGLQAPVLNQGSAQLYADPQARQKLFQGTKSGQFEGSAYTAGWDILAAPTFALSPPDAAHWGQSVTDQGTNPPAGSQPPANAFQLIASQFSAQFQVGKAPPLKGTTEVQIYGTVGVVQDPASKAYLARLSPVSVWLDESQMPGWTQAILNLIIGFILKTAEDMLKGWAIPALTFSKEVDGVTVTVALAEPPVVAVDQSRLLLAACLQSRGKPVDISGVQWPEQPLFALVTPNVLQEVVAQVSAQLKGKQLSKSGDYKSLLSWDASATIGDLSVTQDPSDMTKLTASVQASFDATLKPLGIGGPCAVSAAGGTL